MGHSGYYTSYLRMPISFKGRMETTFNKRTPSVGTNHRDVRANTGMVVH